MKRSRNPSDDVPFTARLPDGRTLFVLVPAKWCVIDSTGEVMFRAEAVRFIDRIQALAMKTPTHPTPGLIRALREALGMTQAALASTLGVDAMSVSRWERGASRPSEKAARALDRLRRAAGRRGTVVAA